MGFCMTLFKRLARQIEIKNLSLERLLATMRAFNMLYDPLTKTDALEESVGEIFIKQIKSVTAAIRKTGKRPKAKQFLTLLQANMHPTQRNQLSQTIKQHYYSKMYL